MLKPSDTVAIVCCSNGQKSTYKSKITQLEYTLVSLGLNVIFSDYIYEKEGVASACAKERARGLMDFYKDDEIKAIFDISGGDIANGVLPYLDYDVIAKNEKMFWGYSDLTTIINAIYTMTGKASVLFQVRNLIYDYKEQQINDFKELIDTNKSSLFDFKYEFIQGNKMKGVVIGGNIRCFLKLAGTKYMPDFAGKILLLESFGGCADKIETYLCQLEQIGAFDKIEGILLGTFTQMEEEESKPDVVTLIKRIVRDDMPIAVTKQIGHGKDSKGIVVGEEMELWE